MSSIEIKKAKIKNGIFLAYEYVQKADDIENKITTSSDAPIHEDLRGAFGRLVPHFALMTEEVNEFDVDGVIRQDEEAECLAKFEVTGVTIAGTGDSEGVVISGYKTLESGKVVNFNTPFQKFEDEYQYSEELYNAVAMVRTEVYEYMEGKQAPRKEVGSFDFGDEDEEAFSMPNPADEILNNLPENVEVSISSGGQTKKLGRGKKKEFSEEAE